MIEFLGSIVAAYVIFFMLDRIFTRRRPVKLKEGDFVQEINGQFYIVREVASAPTPDVVPHQRRPALKVVK
jgi:hypothetical protein